MKRKITFLIAAVMLLVMITQSYKAIGQTRSTSITTFKSGTTPGVGGTLPYETGGLAWTTSIAPNGWESSSPYRGWQYTTGNSPDIKYTISNAVITNVTIVASTNYKSGKKNYISVHVGDSEFESQKELSGNNNEYSFTDDGKTGEIKVTLTSGGESNSKSMWIKSITVTYTPTHSLTYSATEGGSITSVMNGSTSVSNGSQVAEGTTLNIVAEASSGYTFNGWTQTGAGNSFGNAANLSTTFTMGTENATMTANFIVTPSTPYFTAANVDLVYNALSGTINYTVNNSKDGGKVSAACTAGDSWISDVAVTDEDDNENTVTFKTTKNTGAQRDGIIRLTYTYDTKTTVTKDVTITQAEMPQLATPEFTAVTSGKGKVTPIWDDVDNATSYTVRYSTSENFATHTDVPSIESGNDITGLTNETKYYFKLKAVGDGISYRDSEWSDAVSSTPNARETITITSSSIDDFSGYKWYEWTAGGISGQVYAYSNSGIQFNSSKDGYWIYNTVAVPGTIKLVKMIKASGTDQTWTLKVGTSLIDETGEGTIMGSSQTVGTSGATWNVTGDYDYFLLYVSGGATVIGSIEITYIPKYTVTYNANGGTGDAPAVASYYEAASVTAAAANTFTVPSANHTFNTWNTKADGSGTSYPAGEAFSMPGANITLYAQWNRNIPVDGNNEITEDVTVAAGETVTISSITKIPNGRTLTINGTLVSATAANLVVEDGGQLIVNNAGVQATIKKAIEVPTKTATNWYTIASPVAGISIGTPAQTGNVVNLKNAEYDLYRYNETAMNWENHKNTAAHADFTTLEAGRGYLYRRDGAATLEYTGEVNGSASVTYSVTKGASNTDIQGFNLIGNPYSHDIYKGKGGALDDTKLNTGYYRLNNDASWGAVIGYGTAIKSGEGFLVQANTAGDITIYNNNNVATGNESKSGNDYIQFNVANGEYSDVAYALFQEGLGLNKINHRNPDVPMIYINQNNEDFAIAMMKDDTKSFNLNFKPMTMGKYTLSYKAEGDFNYLHVIDRLTGEDVDMLLEGEYSFISAPGDNENRFIVRLGYMPNNEGTENEIFAYQNGSDVIVSGDGELQVFDVTGRMVATQRVNGVETINIPAQGVYIFKLNEKVQKIVVR